MVIDTSVIVALIFKESDEDALLGKIDSDPVRLLSAVSFVESSVVIAGRLGEAGVDKLDLLLESLVIELAPVDQEQSFIARRAYNRYGKGKHPARLNLGDCFAYALSIATDEPLLFKGNDFSQTDVTCA